MVEEPRKASDVLISLEFKVDQLLSLYKSQDLILKVMANKISSLEKYIMNNSLPTIPTINSFNEIKAPPISISSEAPIPIEEFPQGFRRTSRPETYANVDAVSMPTPVKKSVQTKPVKVEPPSQQVEKEINLPVQFPEFKEVQKISLPKKEASIPKEVESFDSGRKIPVEQRIVDKNGKAIFLANVEISDAEGNSSYKTRTNGVGKWQASLSPGKYQIKINKQESVSKEKLELTQDILVDGSANTQSFPVLICK